MGGPAYRARQREKGLCLSCPKPNNGSPWCDYHQEQVRFYRRVHRKKDIAIRANEGRCTSCGKKLHEYFDEGHTNCDKCRDRRATLWN